MSSNTENVQLWKSATMSSVEWKTVLMDINQCSTYDVYVLNSSKQTEMFVYCENVCGMFVG
jgi:hypothetical protein